MALKPADDVQRQEEEEEDLAMKPAAGLQRLDAGGTPQIDAETERGIKATRGGGSPIADNVRASMEQGFGADFGRVRVHTDARADTLNRSLKAKAFTTGKDVFFRRAHTIP